MALRSSWGNFTLAPFLYPVVFRAGASSRVARVARVAALQGSPPASAPGSTSRRLVSMVNELAESRLNPAPEDYSAPSFADSAELSLHAGRGGNGCISFLRDAYLPDGPPNGGDGGTGGNVFIQAAHGETSLHKLARRRFMRAGKGKNGQGSARGGTRGDDIIITVPVGTIVRELEREDPAAEEARQVRLWRGLQKQRNREIRLAQEERARAIKAGELDEDAPEPTFKEIDDEDDPEMLDPHRGKWLLYPGLTKSEMRSASFPHLPRRDRLLHQPPTPVYLDLSRPTPQPILLATGGLGGLGNPHFTSKDYPRPMFATRGDEAVSMKIALELKLLADVGLVGLPNAGKSTLLRAVTNSRTRVGSWAFTTLQPNIGTVVLDKYSGRPLAKSLRRQEQQQQHFDSAGGGGGSDIADPRTRFTIADIPGLIEGAHLDRGLGIAFLRHVERAGVLAFVIDLAAGDAVKALKALWHEVGLYAEMRREEEHDRQTESRIDWDGGWPSDGQTVDLTTADYAGTAAPAGLHIAGKPWFVVATKADLPGTQDNFGELQKYLESVAAGQEPHPSGVKDGWVSNVAAIPVSAINGQGVDRIVHWTVGLLDQ